MHPPTIPAILRSPIRSFRSLVFVANNAIFVAAEWLGDSCKGSGSGGAPILDPTTHKEAYHLALIKDAENTELGAGIEISPEKVA